jgi:hypothetical protein
MRLDRTTLTVAKNAQLLEALLALDSLTSQAGRDDVVGRLTPRWKSDIPRRDNHRADVAAIWSTASSHDGLAELWSAIAVFESGSPAFTALTRLVDELTAFVAANEDLYPHLDAFVAAVGRAPRPTIAFWLEKVRSVVGEVTWDVREPFRDLLLRLGEYRPDLAGDSFPLFFVLDGVAGDVLLDAAVLATLRGALDQIALGRKVSPPAIGRLRATVDAARRRAVDGGGPAAPPGEPSILVVLEPDRELTPPHYTVRVYDWVPWESEAMAGEMGTRGRAQNPSDARPPCTREALLSDPRRAELGAEIGRRLRTRPMEKPLVEFLVPAALICEDFESIEIDVVGLGDAALYQPLGTWARVVVRPFDRWDAAFRQNAGLLAFWAARWRAFRSHVGGPLPSWWWRAGLPAELGRFRAEHGDVGCLGLGFAPTTPELAMRVYNALLAVGAPVSLWTREPIQGDIERLLREVVDAAEPSDLRDRVHSARAKAQDAGLTPHVGRSLTLVWDEPDRPPKPVT